MEYPGGRYSYSMQVLQILNRLNKVRNFFGISDLTHFSFAKPFTKLKSNVPKEVGLGHPSYNTLGYISKN